MTWNDTYEMNPNYYYDYIDDATYIEPVRISKIKPIVIITIVIGAY